MRLMRQRVAAYALVEYEFDSCLSRRIDAGRKDFGPPTTDGHSVDWTRERWLLDDDGAESLSTPASKRGADQTVVPPLNSSDLSEGGRTARGSTHKYSGATPN